VKFKHIAAAALMPAMAASVALSAGTASAATHPLVHGRAHDVSHGGSRRRAHRGARSGARGNPSRWVTVQAGDTLSGIAAAYRMTWEAIYATPPNVRHVHNPNDLAVGERLRIPENPKWRAAQFRRKYAAKLRREAAAAHQTPAAQPQAAVQPAVALPVTAGMSSFERCVAWRESGDNPTASSAGMFGILPSTWAELGYSGTAGQASVALQKVAFNRLYAEYGVQPWAPSDGC
jgi:LysM repeat protein